jgi:hypothetical protein
MIWVIGVGLYAQEQLRVDAKLIEAPAGVKLTPADCVFEGGLEKRGAHLLSRPRIITTSGTPATVFVGQTFPVLDAEDKLQTNVQTCIEFQIAPRVEGDMIHYTASALVRTAAPQTQARGPVQAEFLTREYYFSGACKSGEAVLISTRSIHANRTLLFHLTFTRLPGN